MAAQACPNVYLESVEAAANTGEEPNQVWYQTKLGTHVGQCKQRMLGGSRSVYAKRSYNPAAPQSRLPLSAGLLCSIAQNVRNRRMPNGTYGGVRGRKTKEIGGNLRKSFVFLLLDYLVAPFPSPSPAVCHPPKQPFSWTNRPFALGPQRHLPAC